MSMCRGLRPKTLAYLFRDLGVTRKKVKTFPFSTPNTRRPNQAPGKWKATGFFWDVKALT